MILNIREFELALDAFINAVQIDSSSEQAAKGCRVVVARIKSRKDRQYEL